ncbi:MAG: hypothetical protein IPM48_04525 [Saprospiraceae bacterium]|nr:hypothetical protein [Saprospiraceae bacterium]
MESQQSQQTNGMLLFEDLPNDFKEFYLKFHEDSLFQISRITFPLQGLPEQADPEFIGDEPYYWSADQWSFQKIAFPDKDKYRTEYDLMADVLIEERIHELKYGLTMIRRFSKAADGWGLIYYAGLNKYKPATEIQN